MAELYQKKHIKVILGKWKWTATHAKISGMAPEPGEPPRTSNSLRDRSRQLMVAIGTVIAVIGTVMGFLSDTLGVWDVIREQLEGPTEVVTVPGQLLNGNMFST